MTIIMKPNSMKKPLVQEFHEPCDEHKVDIPVIKKGALPLPVLEIHRQSWYSMKCITATAFVMVLTGIASGVLLYHMYDSTKTLRGYQGYCSIPINAKKQSSQLIEPNYRIVPIHWNSVEDDDDVQIFSTLDETTSDDIADALHEILDIRGAMEKIYVSYNGQRINFINDFTSNMSGIIDSDRCFYMELDPDLAMTPELLVVSLKSGARLDTTPVRTTLRADLQTPTEGRNTATLTAITEACTGKPTYRLYKDETGSTIRKRSASLPLEYVQFAGRHVQQIEVANFHELLDFEKNSADK